MKKFGIFFMVVLTLVFMTGCGESQIKSITYTNLSGKNITVKPAYYYTINNIEIVDLKNNILAETDIYFDYKYYVYDEAGEKRVSTDDIAYVGCDYLYYSTVGEKYYNTSSNSENNFNISQCAVSFNRPEYEIIIWSKKHNKEVKVMLNFKSSFKKLALKAKQDGSFYNISYPIEGFKRPGDICYKTISVSVNNVMITY